MFEDFPKLVQNLEQMALFIHVLSGEKYGLKYQVRAGIRIGRDHGEIRIPDKRVSSLHAEIQVSPLGGFVLIDKSSTHGIMAGGYKVKDVMLEAGVQFSLGKTRFEIIEGSEELKAEKLNSDETDKQMVRRAIEGISILSTRNKPSVSLLPFSRPVRVDFLEGIELGRSLILGYGPREFGGGSLDIEIYEPGCPDVAFILFSDAGRLKFQTKHPDMVAVNGRSIQNVDLAAGDQIRIGQTLIKIGFEYGSN